MLESHTRSYRRLLLLAAATAVLASCESGAAETADDSTDAGPDCALVLERASAPWRLSSACHASTFQVAAEVSIDDEWVPVLCDDLGCSAGGHQVRVTATAGDTFALGYELTPVAPATVRGFRTTLRGAVPGARGWISNGWQSWSQSGALSIGGPPDEGATERALRLQGDPETLRTGAELSWFYTVVGGGDEAMAAGATSSRHFRSWTQVYRDSDELVVRLVDSDLGTPSPTAAGEPIASEAWALTIHTDAAVAFAAWADRLEWRSAATGAEVPFGYNTWYDLWDSVSATDVLEIAAIVRREVGTRFPERTTRIVVDDGWQLAWGDWRPNDKFPDGLEGLAATLHSEGHEVGVWLAPLLVDADLPVVAEHPDWFVEGASFTHLKNGQMRVLDLTHPDAAAYLAASLRQLVEWGFDFLKIDFLFAGTFEGARHDGSSAMAGYRASLAAIRDAVGDEVTLVAVGAPPVASFPFVDAWRVGGDIAFEPIGPSWPFVANQARSVSARWALCEHILCDADPPLLRVLPQNEVEAGAWVAAIAGGSYFLSDDLRALDAERFEWGLTSALVAAGTSGAPWRPHDAFAGVLPSELVNSAVDHFSPTADTVVPEEWIGPAGERLHFNFGEATRVVDGEPLAPRSARLIPAPLGAN